MGLNIVDGCIRCESEKEYTAFDEQEETILVGLEGYGLRGQ